MAKQRRKGSECFNCHTPFTRNENYCPNCGQENHNRQASTRMLLDDFLKDYIAFDSKLFKSIVPLLTKPGFITNEFLNGKRQKYIPPIRVFLFLSFVYFGLTYLFSDGSTAGSITINGEEQGSEAGRAFYDQFINNFNLVVFLFTPLQALLIMMLFRSKERKYYVNFFVYTLHLFSFFFILGIFFVTINDLLTGLSDSIIVDYTLIGILIVMAAYIIIYSIISLKRVFNKRNNILRYFVLLIISLAIFTLILIGFILTLATLFQFD